MTNLEILIGDSGSLVGTELSLAEIGKRMGFPIEGCISFSASVATLLQMNFFSKLKLAYTKLRGWIKMINILYEKFRKNQ